MQFTTSDVRRQIQDGPQGTGAIDEDGFDEWYRAARQDARAQVIEWFHEHIGGLWPSVVEEARERFDVPYPAAVLVPAQEGKK